MKTFFKIFVAIVAVVLFSGFTTDKDKKVVTTSFQVSGVCGMCETVIEKSVDVRGVVAADYTLETQTLEISYKPSKITEDQIHFLINEAGYDTEVSKATAEQYSRVHSCCKYREMEKH